jgi:hypothetical protein
MVSDVHNRQLRDKAILVPIEKFLTAAPGAMQVAPSDALNAWANTAHRQSLATVLRLATLTAALGFGSGPLFCCESPCPSRRGRGSRR